MKILRIALKNIASIAGRHSVDFRHEPLRSAGLFAISGPTGSGKSSLLDALCLALYDNTPRLSPIGKTADLEDGVTQRDPRNLLRKGTADGFAEVDFTGVDGCDYRARWEVRRSHNKTDGKLQSTEHTLYRLPGGTSVPEIVASAKKTEVLAAIIEKIGLTYDQFTRAVLLAQNDFAAFLKANDNERAEVLEALTSTGRFAAISIAIFKRARAEEDTVAALRARQGGIQPLTTEDRSAIEQTLTEDCATLAQLDKSRSILDRQTVWFARHAEFSDALASASTSLDNARLAHDAAAARRAQLDRIRRAQTLSPQHTAARLARETLAATVTRKNETAQKLALSTETVARADAALTDAARGLAGIRQKITDSRPEIQTARELDARIQNLAENHARIQKTATSARAAAEAADKEFQSMRLRQASLDDEYSTLRPELLRHSALAPFLADLTAWQDRVDAAARAAADLTQASASAAASEKKHAQLIARRDELRPEGDRLAAATGQTVVALDAAETGLRSIDRDALERDRENYDLRLAQFNTLKDSARDLARLSDAHRQNTGEAAALTRAIASLAAEMAAIETQKLPAAITAAETAAQLLKASELAVDDHARLFRAALQSGQPCPVCGSAHHPYSERAPSADTVALRQLNTEKKRLEKVRADLVATLAQQRRQHAADAGRLEKLNTQLHDDAVAIAARKAALEQLPLARECLADLATAEAQLRNEAGKLAARQREYNAALQKRDAARAAHDAARETQAAWEKGCAKLQQEIATAAHEAQTAGSILNRMTMDAGQKTASLREARILEAAGFSIDGTPTIADARDFRRETDAYRAAATRAAELQKLLAEIAPTLELLRRRQEETTAHAADEATASKTAATTLAAAREQRRLLLGGQTVAECEAAQQNALAAAERRHETASLAAGEARAAHRSASDAVDAANAACVEAAAQQQITADQLAAALAALDGVLTPLTLAELDELLKIPARHIADETRALEKLDHALTTAHGALAVHQENLSAHLGAPGHPDIDFASLGEDALHAAFEARRTQLREEISALGERKNAAQILRDQHQAALLADDRQRAAVADLLTEIEMAEKRADPWLRLSEFIGSADGKKFRLIAQQHTLALLLTYANAQLENLSPRYRLERIPGSLNLIVRDRDMADESRSIHSLSGGESFLVSLALALGLASLTSNRLRVESLFIDEGFGSLDSDTLNTAMNALMHLESQGRRVGVISHVTEMAEAIPVRIEIRKDRSGASRIVVPGAPSDPAFAAEDSTARADANGGEPVMSEAAIDAFVVKIRNTLAAAPKRKLSSLLLNKLLSPDMDWRAFEAARNQMLANGEIFLSGRSYCLAESESGQT